MYGLPCTPAITFTVPRDLPYFLPGILLGVSNGLCEHASSVFNFASTSSDQFSHASSEHFKNYKWQAAALRKFSTCWNLSFLKHCFAPSNLADTFKTGQQA